MNFKLWLIENEEKTQHIKKIIDGQGLILFFTTKNGLFGAPEEGRIVFANLKKPNSDIPDGWADDANFAAFDLMKALLGDRVENIFGHKDMKKIKVIDPEKAIEMLTNAPSNKETADNLKHKHSKDGIGMIKLKDKK